MHTFLLAAILFALCIALPALRRACGIVALLVLLLVLWAASLDGDKRTDTKPAVAATAPASPLPTPSVTPSAPSSAPSIEPSPKPAAPEPKRKIIQN
jgi:hypothetical protein